MTKPPIIIISGGKRYHRDLAFDGFRNLGSIDSIAKSDGDVVVATLFFQDIRIKSRRIAHRSTRIHAPSYTYEVVERSIIIVSFFFFFLIWQYNWCICINFVFSFSISRFFFFLILTFSLAFRITP